MDADVTSAGAACRLSMTAEEFDDFERPCSVFLHNMRPASCRRGLALCCGRRQSLDIMAHLILDAGAIELLGQHLRPLH